MPRIRDFCYRIYWKLERWIAPGLQSSQYHYKEVLESLLPDNGSWLELGCGHQILPGWLDSSRDVAVSLVRRTKRTVGLDPSFEAIRGHTTIRHRVVATIEHAPFRGKSFDLITANMVMEHVQNPEAALAEVYRLLRPGGKFVFHTPNLWNYKFMLASFVPQSIKNKLVWLLEGRPEADIFPTVYAINSASKIEELGARCGFRMVELKMVNSTAITAMFFPLAILELFFIRFLEGDFSKNYRSNIIATLEKPGIGPASEVDMGAVATYGVRSAEGLRLAPPPSI